MGLFSNVSNFVEKKLKERDVRKKEDKEIDEIRHRALQEERKKSAPILAKKQAALEVNQKIEKIKAGKGSGGLNFGNIQDIAHSIGQSTGNKFNEDFNNMMGGRGSGGKGHAKKSDSLMGSSNPFNDEYNKMFGGPAQKTSRASKAHKKGGWGRLKL